MIEFICMPPHIEAAGECRILNTFANVGTRFNKSQILFTYEFDGALFEERATCGGRVRAVFFKTGDLLCGNTPIIAFERE